MKPQKGLGRGLDAIFGSEAVDAKLKPMSQMAEIEIADIIDNVADTCPSVETKILVNGAGGGLTSVDADNKPILPEGELIGPALSGPEGVCAAGIQREGWLDFNTGVRAASEDFARCQTLARDPMLMYFSSGTSGNPKMVLHDSEYAIAHLVTAKHWHNVDPEGLHFTIDYPLHAYDKK